MRLLIVFAVVFFISLPAVHAQSEAVNTVTKPATKSALASQSLLLDVSPLGQEKLVAVGQYGHILLSNDGENWQQANVPVQATLTRVFFLNEQLGWAVGHDATILHSQDGGLNWQIQQSLPSLQKPLLDIYFKDAKQGIAVGAYGQVFRTNDGGTTWQSEFHQEFLLADDVDYINDLKMEDEQAYLDEIAFILPHFNGLVAHDNSLFLMGETGLLAQSNDFGHTWQKVSNFYQGSFFSLAGIGSGDFLVAGLRGHVFRRAQGERQWREVSTGSTALLNDIVVSEEDGTIFILGNNGVLLVSIDNGESFIEKPQHDGKTLIAGVWFKGRLIVVSDVGVKIINLSKD